MLHIACGERRNRRREGDPAALWRESDNRRSDGTPPVPGFPQPFLITFTPSREQTRPLREIDVRDQQPLFAVSVFSDVVAICELMQSERGRNLILQFVISVQSNDPAYPEGHIARRVYLGRYLTCVFRSSNKVLKAFGVV